MLSYLPPRSFDDFTVPVRADGSSLVATEQPDDYTIYITWLADYLHDVALPLTPDQEAWLRNVHPTSTPEEVIFRCSDAYGYALWELIAVEDHFTLGHTWEEYQTSQRNIWDELGCESGGFTFEESSEMNETIYERLRREWVVEEKIDFYWSHADIPFRPLLAWAFRQIPEHKKRVEQVDWYFTNFSNNAQK
jgi:hypothetical protein